MFINFKDTPIMILDKENSKLVSIVDAILTRTIDELISNSNASLTIERRNNEFGFQIVARTESLAIDNLVRGLELLDKPQGALITKTMEIVSTRLNISSEHLIESLKNAEYVLSILEGEIAPKETLPSTANIFLNRLISQINQKYFTVSINKSTIPMDNYDSEIVLELPHFNDVLTGNYTLPDLEELYEVPSGYRTFYWKDYTDANGIPPSYVVGNPEMNKTDIMENESELYKQLMSIFEYCVKAEYEISREDESFLLKRPKAWVDFMKDMIYIALRHNWRHTILIPRYEDIESSVSGSEDDEEGSGVDELLSNFVVDAPEKDVMAKITQLRQEGLLRHNVNTLPNGFENTIDFINFIESKNPTPDNYIVAFIKLIRWGNNKVSRLYLPSREDFYLSLDLFNRRGDYSNEPTEPVYIDGYNFIPVNILFYEINPTINIKSKIGLVDDLNFIVPGIYANKLSKITTTGQRINQPYFIDALRLLEIYRNKEEDRYVYGLDYQNGKFVYRNNKAEDLFSGIRNDFSEEPFLNEYGFSLASDELIYEMSDILAEDFIDVDIPSKKEELNLPRIIEYFKEPSMESIPKYMHNWVLKIASIYKIALEREVESLDLATLLNILNEHIDSIEVEVQTRKLDFNLSNHFQQETEIEKEKEVIVEEGDFDLSVIKREDYIKTGNIEEAYRIVNSEGKLAFYLTKQSEIYDKDTVVNSILGEKTHTVAQVAMLLIKNNASKELIHLVVEEL